MSPEEKNVQYIDEAKVARVLTMQELIPTMRRAMVDFSTGRVEQPTRRILEVQEHGGYFAGMPACSADVVGAKLLAFYPHNARHGLHTHMALIVLFRPETGEPLAVIDGRLITEMRTAAVTATFVDTVTSPDVSSLAVLGAGIQGKSHIEALRLVRHFEDIRIWNRTPGRAEQLAHELGARAVSCEEAVRGADVVVSATASSEPILDGRWLSPHATVASVGWSGADGAELDAHTMQHTVLVDSRDGALTESGNVRRHEARIHGELGELLAGTLQLPARRADTDTPGIVVFESIGMACQDMAAASLVYEKLQLETEHGTE